MEETVEEKEHEEAVEAEETGAMVSDNFTAEDARSKEAGEVFLTGFGGAEWGQIAYVIFRDQVRSLSRDEAEPELTASHRSSTLSCRCASSPRHRSKSLFSQRFSQGLVWGVGGLYLGAFWAWNRKRLELASPTPRSGGGLLEKWGIKLR